nr:PREDICTED: E3 ubiquitin-protein ligase MBR2-like isoform X2 [Musa acuminata subsp. malaccensis]
MFRNFLKDERSVEDFEKFFFREFARNLFISNSLFSYPFPFHGLRQRRLAVTGPPQPPPPPPQLLEAIPRRPEPSDLFPAAHGQEEGGAFRVGGASEEASQAYAPAAASARSYSDWQRNRPRGKAKRKEERRSRDGGDVWCAPRVPFASEASVDCVVSYRRLAGSGRPDAADRTHSETPHLPISGVHQEHTSAFMDSSLELDAPLFGHDLLSSGHLHNLPMYRQTPSRLEEELLELGDRIGHVSTGLKEEEIIGSLRKVKHSFFYALKRFFSTEIDGKCSICQEEYEANDEIGELDCGHSYHVFCIKQWLLQNNVCPVSKTSVPRT